MPKHFSAESSTYTWQLHISLIAPLYQVNDPLIRTLVSKSISADVKKKHITDQQIALNAQEKTSPVRATPSSWLQLFRNQRNDRCNNTHAPSPFRALSPNITKRAETKRPSKNPNRSSASTNKHSPEGKPNLLTRRRGASRRCSNKRGEKKEKKQKSPRNGKRIPSEWKGAERIGSRTASRTSLIWKRHARGRGRLYQQQWPPLLGTEEAEHEGNLRGGGERSDRSGGLLLACYVVFGWKKE